MHELGFKVVNKRTGEVVEGAYYIARSGELCKEHKVKGMVLADKFLTALQFIGKVDSKGQQIYKDAILKRKDGTLYAVTYLSDEAQYYMKLLVNSPRECDRSWQYMIDSTIVGNRFMPEFRGEE